MPATEADVAPRIEWMKIESLTSHRLCSIQLDDISGKTLYDDSSSAS